MEVTAAPPELVQFSYNEIQEFGNRLQSDSFLGRGAYGNVFKGRIPPQNRWGIGASDIAIKVCTRTNEKQIQYQMEKHILGSINHDNIIKLIGYHDDETHLFLVYEYMSRGTVKENIPELDWHTTIQILTEMALAIKYLHTQDPRIIFRDLKSENVLLDNNFKAKLSDFGLARRGDDGLQTGGAQGTSHVQGIHGDVTTESDIFSIGILILEMLTKKSNLVHLDQLPDWVKAQKIRRGTTSVFRPKTNVSKIIHKILQNTGCRFEDGKKAIKLGLRCVSQTNTERPTIQEVRDVLGGLRVDGGGIIDALRWKLGF